MAISFTVSYTFSPSTTISSSQVNTNFSDNAAVWTGLEAKTKSFSALKVDASPTLTTDVAIKSYVDSLMSYRRPVLKYSSGTLVTIETGNDGTSGDVTVLFPDGSSRTTNNSTYTNINFAQNAVLSGTKQGGLRTGSQSANLWYFCYAVKATDTSDVIGVADVVPPNQTNWATLNSNFGANSWIYLGVVRNGDQSGATNVILKFSQAGNMTSLYNACAGNSVALPGIRFASTASAASLTYTYAAGVSGQTIPANVSLVTFTGAAGNATSTLFGNQGNTYYFMGCTNTAIQAVCRAANVGIADGFGVFPSSSVPQDIVLSGWVDGALGVGSNPGI